MRKKIALLVAVLVLSAVQAGPGAAWMRRGGSTYQGGHWGAAVASASAANAYGVGDVYAALPGGCSYARYGGGAYYDCEGTWFAAAYGANGVHYRVVPAL